jgi:hypothetical protein
MVFAYHAYPGFTSARHQRRSPFIEIQGGGDPCGGLEEMVASPWGQ